MIARKATSTPLNPKSKVQNQSKGRLGIGTIPCVFCEKRRIKKLWCIFWYFLVFKREKKICREAWQKANFRKMWSLFGLRGAWAIYSPSTLYKAMALVGLLALKGLKMCWYGHPWKDVDFFVSEKVWILKIQLSDKRLWLSEVCGASIGASPRFLWHLSHSNSDFNLWTVIGTRIW